MANEQEAASADRMERARAILATCLEMRKKVHDFLHMNEEQQKIQDQEQIHSAFSHLANCENRDAFITVSGSAQGSGQCGALWKKISKEYDPYSDLVCEHLMRVTNPKLWLELEEARRKDEAGIKPNASDRFLNWVFEWMFPSQKNSRGKKEKRMAKVENIPTHDCTRSVDFIKRFLAMTKEERAARNLQALKDALYHVYWCSNDSCEERWASLIKDVGHDPSLSNIKDKELRDLILEMQGKPDPVSRLMPQSGIFDIHEE